MKTRKTFRWRLPRWCRGVLIAGIMLIALAAAALGAADEITPVDMAIIDEIPSLAPDEEPEIINGSLEQWEDGAPVGWTVKLLAWKNRGEEPRSTPREIAGPGMMLQGDASTNEWYSVHQSFPVRPKVCYRLTFEGYVKDLEREDQQNHNCYVGVIIKDAAGETISTLTRDVSAPDWAADGLVFSPPEGAATGELTIFLSQSGTLCVKNVDVQYMRPEDSFEVLVEDMDRNYSFFAPKGINWKELTERYRDKAEGAKSTREFVDVVAGMLGELKDTHIRIYSPGGPRLVVYHSDYKANCNHGAVIRTLRDARHIGGLRFVGRTEKGYGVVAVTALTADEGSMGELLTAIEGLFDAPGMIVDLRMCGGGAEPLGQRIAAMFVDKRRKYAGSMFRSGPAHDDFRTSGRFIEPREGTTYRRPIICLIGPGCVSSGEGFVLMMRCLPHVKLFGQSTRGGSGNPRPVRLPNGVSVSYSRWVPLLPDGTPIEDAGIAPDFVIKHEGPGDPTFDAAVTSNPTLAARKLRRCIIVRAPDLKTSSCRGDRVVVPGAHVRSVPNEETVAYLLILPPRRQHPKSQASRPRIRPLAATGRADGQAAGRSRTPSDGCVVATRYEKAHFHDGQVDGGSNVAVAGSRERNASLHVDCQIASHLGR